MKIRLNIPPDKRDKLLLDVLYILLNVREKKMEWEKKFGAARREALKEWEDRADKLLSDLGIPVNPKL